MNNAAQRNYPYPHGSAFDSFESLMKFACNSQAKRGDSQDYFQKMLAQMLIQFKEAQR